MARHDALQGSLPLLVLKLLARRGPLHGYGIATQIEGMSDETLRVEEGSLYPALHRLEETGWIKARWTTTDTGRRAQAARRFGNPLRLREQSRDIKLLPWLDSIVRDIRLGLRMLRKNAVVTVAALVSLSLALGACVAAFSLVEALILRPLPVRHPEQ